MTRLILVSALSALSISHAHAEIQSMSSGEMTETYVKDSTIIVTPAKKAETKRQVVTYTITPGEPVKTDSELEAERAQQQLQNVTAVEEANRAAFEVDDKFAQIPAPQVEFPDLVPREIPYGIQIPEGPYTAADLIGQTNGLDSLPFGPELNTSFDGQQYTITIGNIPGYDPVNLPQSYQGQMLELQPRDSGGFDIILTPPPQ